MNLLARLAYLESEQYRDGRWTALCRLIEKLTPQMTTDRHASAREATALRALLRECERLDLYGCLMNALVDSADPPERPALVIAKPPQRSRTRRAPVQQSAARGRSRAA